MHINQLSTNPSFTNVEEFKTYLEEMGLFPTLVETEDDGSFSAYLAARRSLLKAFGHFMELGLRASARHEPDDNDAYHLNVHPPVELPVVVTIDIWLN